MVTPIECKHSSHIGHPLCSILSRKAQVLFIVINIFTLGIPILLCSLINWLESKKTAKKTPSLPPLSHLSDIEQDAFKFTYEEFTKREETLSYSFAANKISLEPFNEHIPKLTAMYFEFLRVYQETTTLEGYETISDQERAQAAYNLIRIGYVLFLYTLEELNTFASKTHQSPRTAMLNPQSYACYTLMFILLDYHLLRGSAFMEDGKNMFPEVLTRESSLFYQEETLFDKCRRLHNTAVSKMNPYLGQDETRVRWLVLDIKGVNFDLDPGPI